MMIEVILLPKSRWKVVIFTQVYFLLSPFVVRGPRRNFLPFTLSGSRSFLLFLLSFPPFIFPLLHPLLSPPLLLRLPYCLLNLLRFVSSLNWNVFSCFR